MNKAIAKQWVEALRSGRYQQGIGSLNKYDRYCCLGVLTDLYLKETNQTWKENGDDGKCPELSETLACSHMFLDPRIQTWAELSDDRVSNFITMNDRRQWSFEQIAAEIEKMNDSAEKHGTESIV